FSMGPSSICLSQKFSMGRSLFSPKLLWLLPGIHYDYSMKKAFKTIHLEVDKQIAILKFNRPEHNNGYTEEMDLELLDAIQVLAAPEVRSVGLTGEGTEFSIGFAPVGMRDHVAEAPQLFRKATAYLHQVIAELRRLPKPVIAAVNGAAAGT